MSNLGSQIIFKQLLQRHGLIRIPMIQRDYAQGRPSEEKVLKEFLDALEDALNKPVADPSLPLNLDFIYGSVEGDDETRFLPLDGQQRLTTLFLLHWYLAWKDNLLDEFRLLFQANGNARFSYSVRPSSKEFFDELVAYEPDCRPEKVQQLSKLITDQLWYFRSWRLDPTVQSTLAVLDVVHLRFASTNGLFERLINEKQPAITFELLDLNNFGLSDDLYIKMNARGKPLTAFETFKARYEQELAKQFHGEFLPIRNENFTIAEFVARRMDTEWADLFWTHRDRSSNLYDNAIMNVFRAIALITRNPESSTYLVDIEILRDGFKAPSYSDFYSRGWLDREFTTTLIYLLDAWSGLDGALATKLPDQRYFNEEGIFKKLVTFGARLSYVDLVQFAGYVFYIREHHIDINQQAFHEWMRVVHNLSVNTDYFRPGDLQRSIGGLLKITEHSSDILTHFATSEKPAGGFSPQQVAEEKLKAELMLRHDDWKPLIDTAEAHSYFRGRIEFLLDFCGATEKSTEQMVNEWDNELHLSFQVQFKSYWEKANIMFSHDGLKNLDAYLWQRALLSIGDYLLPSRRNISFLVNGSTDQASWKRLLQGTGPRVPKARKLLQELWDSLTLDHSLQDQLNNIINRASSLEPWREVLVQTPEAIGYCHQQSIRWESEDEIYLLKTSQMNGSHAELFSYCLYQKIKRTNTSFEPLRLIGYESVIDSYSEPYLRFDFQHNSKTINFKIEFKGKAECGTKEGEDFFIITKRAFVISVASSALDGLKELSNPLARLGFHEDESVVLLRCNKTDIESTLKNIAQSLAKIV